MKFILSLLTLASFVIINIIGIIAFSNYTEIVVTPQIDKETLLVCYLFAQSFLTVMTLGTIQAYKQ